MEKQILLDKISALPETVQQQLLDYVDFLLSRYAQLSGDVNQSHIHEEDELSEQGKAFLETRLAEYEKNPASGIQWKIFRDQINEKHGFNRRSLN